MKKVIYLFFCVFSIIGSSIASELSKDDTKIAKFNSPLAIQEIAKKTFIVTDVVTDSNVLVALMRDKTILIVSSPLETEGTAGIIKWIKKNFSPVRMVAINTHFHLDGTGGNEEYSRSGVETWASDHTQNLLKTHGVKHRMGVAKNEYSDPKLRQRILSGVNVPAQKVFKEAEGLTLSFGGELVKVFYPGPAHSPDNVVVFFPDRKVLFGGCMVRRLETESLGFTGDANISKWAQSARKLLSFNASVVVPGHGKVGGMELIRHTIGLAEAATLRPLM